MDKYTIENNEFFRVVDIIATPKELDVFKSGTKEEKTALAADLKDKFPNVLIDGDELAMVETVYNMFKPELKEEDVYELISFDVALMDGVEGKKFGAYNYKLNDKISNVIIK